MKQLCWLRFSFAVLVPLVRLAFPMPTTREHSSCLEASRATALAAHSAAGLAAAAGLREAARLLRSCEALARAATAALLSVPSSASPVHQGAGATVGLATVASVDAPAAQSAGRRKKKKKRRMATSPRTWSSMATSLQVVALQRFRLLLSRPFRCRRTCQPLCLVARQFLRVYLRRSRHGSVRLAVRPRRRHLRLLWLHLLRCQYLLMQAKVDSPRGRPRCCMVWSPALNWTVAA